MDKRFRGHNISQGGEDGGEYIFSRGMIPVGRQQVVVLQPLRGWECNYVVEAQTTTVDARQNSRMLVWLVSVYPPVACTRHDDIVPTHSTPLRPEPYSMYCAVVCTNSTHTRDGWMVGPHCCTSRIVSYSTIVSADTFTQCFAQVLPVITVATFGCIGDFRAPPTRSTKHQATSTM